MDLLDIAIAKQLAGGGGGSGTDNYNDLSNLPKINDTTLSGNKTSANLGLQSEINSDSKLASDLVDDTNQDNKFVTSAEKTTWNGKQNAIDADHKINADYVDDSTSTNKFVTASDKETWNAKQNAIDNSHKLSSDLVDDANHTNKFVTSTEKNTWNGKQNAIDSEHKLSSSLVSFTTAEAAALASGIDSTKVAQISTNQSNILYALETGAANYAPLEGDNRSGSGYFLDATNSGMKVFTSGTVMHVYCEYTKTTNTQFAIQFTNASRNIIASTSLYAPSESASGTISGDVTLPQDVYGYNAYYSGASGNTCAITNVMICPKNVWDAIQKYIPYSLPNYDLTRLEAEDRASLAEVVDSGAKNKLDVSSPVTVSNITWSADSNSYITASPNNTDTRGWGYYATQYKLNLKAGTYVCVLDIKTASSQAGLGLAMYNSSGTNIFSSDISQIQNKTGFVTWEFELSTADSYGIEFKCYDMVARIMICTKAAFGVSNKFVPFGNDPFYQVPINHNMIYRGRNLGASLTDAQHTALSSGNFADLYLGDYWTKTVTIPAGTYTGGDGEEVTVPAQTNITLKAVIADFDTFYAGYASTYAGINTHHAAVIVTGFSNVVWNKTNSTAGGYVASLIHKWLVGSALPQIETWFGSAKVLSHQKLLTNAITGDAASGWAWSSQKISLLSENQMYGSKVWGGSKATNGGYEPGEAFKHLNVFNQIDANLLFGNNNIWLRDIASAVWAATLYNNGNASFHDASSAWLAPAALILLS